MKKTIILILSIIFIYIFIGFKFSDIEIPEEALRIRILANSNSDYDQSVKNNVKEEIQDYVYNLLKDTKDINEARKIINSNLNSISLLTSKNLESQNYNLPFKINGAVKFNNQAQFNPLKFLECISQDLSIGIKRCR